MDLSNFSYENSNLYNARGEAVMMEWERDWMKKSAEIICKNGGDILNIGHGLGIIDSYIHEYKPNSHTIIEVHPEVHKFMESNGWESKAKIIKSDWRLVIHKLSTFDGIYFDTWGDLHSDFKNGIISKLPYLLNKNGIFSYFYDSDKEDEIINEFCHKNNFKIFYEKLHVDIPKVQYKNGGNYIDPNLEYVLLPIIVNPNEPKIFKTSMI
jgi:hypothetical protein